MEAINASGKSSKPSQKTEPLNISDTVPTLPPPEQVDEDEEKQKEQADEASRPRDRVHLQMGDILKNHLDADYENIVKHNKLHSLPAKMPIIVILENFVRYYAIKQVCSVPNEQEKPKRKYSCSKYEKTNRENVYQLMMTNIELCKEVADGLRIYIDFTLKDYLLYSQEVKQAEHFLSPEYLKSFRYVVPDNV